MTARRPIPGVPQVAARVKGDHARVGEVVASTARAESSDAGDAPRPYWADWLLPDGSECPNCAHQGARCGDMH